MGLFRRLADVGTRSKQAAAIQSRSFSESFVCSERSASCCFSWQFSHTQYNQGVSPQGQTGIATDVQRGLGHEVARVLHESSRVSEGVALTDAIRSHSMRGTNT